MKPETIISTGATYAVEWSGSDYQTRRVSSVPVVSINSYVKSTYPDQGSLLISRTLTPLLRPVYSKPSLSCWTHHSNITIVLSIGVHKVVPGDVTDIRMNGIKKLDHGSSSDPLGQDPVHLAPVGPTKGLKI